MIKYILLIASISTAYAELDSRFVRAIHRIESGGRIGQIVGDSGRSLGPLQISKACWQDSGVRGNYSNVTNLSYAIKVMEGYLNRYCAGAVKSNHFEIMARTWNAGPKGYLKSCSLGYWAKVKNSLKKY